VDIQKETDEGYGLKVTCGEANYGFTAYCFELEGTQLMDIMPDIDTLTESSRGFVESYSVPVHCLMKVAQTEPNLQLCNVDDGAVEELLENTPDLFNVKSINDRVVLTGSEKEVQTFPALCVKENLFDSPWTLIRLEPQYAVEDIIYDETLIGVWPTKGDEIWDIATLDHTTYDMLWFDDDEEVRLYGRLVRRNGVTLMTVFFDKSDLEPNEAYPYHLIPDGFYQIEIKDGGLKLEPVSYKDASALLTYGPDALSDQN
jgi:hypothetical protein